MREALNGASPPRGPIMIARRLIACLLLLLTACQVELYRELKEQDANMIYRELERQGIEVKKTVTDKRKGHYGIEVPRSQAAKAIALLQSKDLPRQGHRGFSLLTKGGGLIPSPRDQRVKFYIALAGELEETLVNLPGVQYARVHFALPEGAGAYSLTKKSQPPQRASVVLKVQEKRFQLHPKDVQALVAGALPKIDPAAVSVVIQLAQPLAARSAPYSSLGPFSVSPSTKLPLTLLFAGLLLVVVLLVVFLILSRRALSRLQLGEEAHEESVKSAG